MSLSSETTEDLFCPQCGYNLRGLSSANCPECGLVLDRADMLYSRLPWTHRQRIGYFRAYWRTLILGTFKTPDLAEELARPVSFRDAQLFRFITIVVGWAPLATASLILALVFQKQGTFLWNGFGMSAMASSVNRFALDVLWPLGAGVTFPGVFPLSLAVFLILLSGVSSYFFHPRSMPPKLQNRGVAMSYYACAAIAFLPVMLLIAGVAVAVANTSFANTSFGFTVTAILGMLAGCAPLVLLFIWWVNTLRLYQRATHASSARTTIVAALLPVLWVLCGIVTLTFITWACGFLVLVVQSLR